MASNTTNNEVHNSHHRLQSLLHHLQPSSNSDSMSANSLQENSNSKPNKIIMLLICLFDGQDENL